MALSANLVAAWDFSDAGSPLVDAVSSVTLSLQGTASISGGGVLCDAAGEGAWTTTPAGLKLALPFSIAFRADTLGAAATYATFFGVTYGDPTGMPYVGYSVAAYPDSSASYKVDWNSAGTYGQHQTADALLTGDHNFLAVFTTTRRALYTDGVLTSEVTGGSYSNPTYDTTSEVGVGDFLSNGDSNTRFYQAYIWDADKSADAADFGADPDGTTWAPWSGGGSITFDEDYQLIIPVQASW